MLSLLLVCLGALGRGFKGGRGQWFFLGGGGGRQMYGVSQWICGELVLIGRVVFGYIVMIIARLEWHPGLHIVNGGV